MAAAFVISRFLSTPSARRATIDNYGLYPCIRISIHALREEGYPRYAARIAGSAKFLSTPSARRATAQLAKRRVKLDKISIHALREEGDLGVHHTTIYRELFLSTPSARRATSLTSHLFCDTTNFYPRPPRGGRRAAEQCEEVSDCISIHALREEGDAYKLSQQAATIISIHALREEGDLFHSSSSRCLIKIFLSTPSARRATQSAWLVRMRKRISIHALREEGDILLSLQWQWA